VEEKGCLVGKKMDLVKVRVAKNYRPLTPIPHPHNFFPQIGHIHGFFGWWIEAMSW